LSTILFGLIGLLRCSYQGWRYCI